MNHPRPQPEFKINIFLISVNPRWYAWQVYRTHPHDLIVGSEARTKVSATQEARAAIRQLEQGAAA